MATTSSRKEKLTIYLARDASKADSDLIKSEKAGAPVSLELEGAESATLYVKIQPPGQRPTWTKLFTSSRMVDDSLFGVSSSVGAVLIVRLAGGTFILSFGMGFHLLKNQAIERDFGLKVTLNTVDPDKLRSLDKASYDHNPLNSRTQSTKDVDIFNLHLDSETEILYAVTGASLVEEFGANVTGRDALTLSVETDLSGISKILEMSLSKYRTKLPDKFSWVENINRVRDLDELEILDLELDERLSKNDYNDLWLGEPEIVDWEGQVGYSFDMYARTPRHVVLSFEDYIEYCDGEELSVSKLKDDVIHINDAEYKSVKSWPAYRCLYAEIDYDNDHYILRNGDWYKVVAEFVEVVDRYLEQLDGYEFDFPLYDHDREEDYNESVSKSIPDFCLMDKKNIKIGGPYDKLEHCDLIKSGSDFVHVKYYRSSSTLSHLFAQGYVAAEAFIKDVGYREKLNPKLPDSIKLADSQCRPDPQNYKVVYAIATKKNIPEELPFFSKVTLKNALKILKALNYQVALAKIDIHPTLEKRKKCKPTK